MRLIQYVAIGGCRLCGFGFVYTKVEGEHLSEP